MTMPTVAPAEPDATTTPSGDRRRGKWTTFYWLRDHSVRSGAQACMTPLGGSVKVGVTAAGAVHLQGLKRCGSVWACNLCAPIIREARATAVDELLFRAMADGCTVVFVTATVQHHAAMPLRRSYDGVTASWRKAFAGRRAKTVDMGGKVRSAAGYVGQIRVVDLTDGVNGWHPHIHAAMVFDRSVSRPRILAYLRERRTDYLSALADAGLSAAPDRRGWDVRTVTARSRDASSAVSRYLCKISGGWGVGLELARGDLKSGRRGGVTAFELLDAAAGGDRISAERWREYEEVTKGRRFLVTGRGLADRYKVDPDAKSDEELASAAAPEDAIVVFYEIPAEDWWRLLKGRHVGELLAHLEEAAREIRPQPPP